MTGAPATYDALCTRLEHVQLLAFDVDDTLIDTFQTSFRRTDSAGKQLGYDPLAMADFQRVYGNIPFPECVTHWYDGVDPANFVDTYARMRDAHPYTAFVDGPKLASTVRKAGFQLAVLTNTPSHRLVPKLDLIGLCGADAPDYCYGRADLPEPKPSGAAFDPLLRASGLTADRVMYVGDAPSDYAAATAAGVGFVGVASGPHPSGTDSQMTMPGITDILNLLSQGPFASCHR